MRQPDQNEMSTSAQQARLVSVIIPAYNCGRYVARAVESVLSQDYRPLEVIVIDDGSTDDTQAQLQPYRDQIRYIYQQNQERSRTRNRGIQEATGEYIAFLDADDLWLPDKVARQVKILESDPSVALVCGLVNYIDAEDRIVLEWPGTPEDVAPCARDVFAALTFDNVIGTPSTVMVRRSCLPKPAFDPHLRQGEDWLLWLQIAAQHLVVQIPEPLCQFRVYPGSYPARMAARGAQQAHQTIFAQLRAALTPEQFPAALYQQAMARTCLNAAMIEVALERQQAARNYLVEACHHDPALFAPTGEWQDRLTGFADTLDQTGTTYAESKAFVISFFDALPPILGNLRQRQRAVLAMLYASRLFNGYGLIAPQQLRTAVLGAAWYDPSWLCNRGFVKIGLETLIGLRR